MMIAGTRSETDWANLKVQLEANPTTDLWQRAYDEFHHARFATRYREPIRLLGDEMEPLGEGFSMVALFCTLIEFFATTELGLNFELKPDKTKHQYGRSEAKAHFVTFLKNTPQFYPIVPKGLADEFYGAVRCGLLHEARTRNGWGIQTNETACSRGLSPGEKPIYRDRLLPALDDYLEDYRSRLVKCPVPGKFTPIQEAFIRKWSHLATA